MSASGRLPPELATAEKRRAFIQKHLKKLEERAKAEAKERQGKEAAPQDPAPKQSRRKKAPKPESQAQINFTDPESRIMKSAGKAFIQGYNAQAAVDAETVLANTQDRPKEISADAGYHSEANLEVLRDRGIEAFIPPEKVKHSEWRTPTAPCGRIPKTATPPATRPTRLLPWPEPPNSSLLPASASHLRLSRNGDWSHGLLDGVLLNASRAAMGGLLQARPSERSCLAKLSDILRAVHFVPRRGERDGRQTGNPAVHPVLHPGGQ